MERARGGSGTSVERCLCLFSPFAVGVFDVMPYRTPLVSLALLCSFIVTLNCGLVRAAEIPTEQRQAIEGIIHDYLLHNPDVLIEALHGAADKLNREADAKTEKGLSDQRREIFDDPATPVGGNPRGDVTIVEVFDYHCHYCNQVPPSLPPLF